MFEYHKKESPIISLLGMGGGIGSYIFTAADTGYEIARSLRFDSSSESYLSRTPSAGNRRTWTWAGWVKISNFGVNRYLFDATTTGSNEHYIRLHTGNTLQVGGDTSSYYQVVTTQLFRDSSAWYHIVVAFDTTQSTDSDRIKIYVNGVQVTQFSTTTWPGPNQEGGVNSANQHNIGRYIGGNARFFDGYLADVWFIDGSALEPTSFGTFDDYDIWQPKRYTGSKSGNSFHLPFSDTTSATTLGYDDSGNNNNWDVYNLSPVAVPSGFKAGYYTGTGSATALPVRTVPSPDFVWIKSRSGASHALYDSIRGFDKRLYSNGTDAEYTYGSSILTPTGTGFNLTTSDADHNTLSPTTNYVAWCWDASGVSQTNYDPESTGATVDYIGNTNTGFSIVKCASPNNTQTRAHGCGAAPDFIIAKAYNSSTEQWHIYHSALGRTYYGTFRDVKFNSSDQWGSQEPDSTYFYVKPLTASGANYSTGMIYYLWAAKAGYSAFGSYSGTGSSGNSVTGLGFKPAMVIIKSSSHDVDWIIEDQDITGTLYPNTADGEYGSGLVQFDDDGFTLTNTTTNSNALGYSYIYAAFAENVIPSDIDSLLDSPQNADTTTTEDTGVGGEIKGNYCTLNPLDTQSPAPILTNGNLQVTGQSGTTYYVGRCTLLCSSGKFYWEATINSGADSTGFYPSPGLERSDSNLNLGFALGGGGSNGVAYMRNGQKYQNGVLTNYGASHAAGDVIGFALDMDNGTLTCYKNGASQGQLASGLLGYSWSPSWNVRESTSIIYNFGQRAFAYQNAGVDRPSAEFKALNTANLPTPTIEEPSNYVGIVTYTGNSTARTITTGFSPDFVWIKSRSVLAAGGLYDVVRGANKLLRPASTLGEDSSYSQLVTAFNSTSFSLGTDDWGGVNDNGITYVAWAWKAGGAPTTDNVAGAGNVPTAGSAKIDGANMTTTLAGSIPATRLSVNTTAKFSIISYTGNSTSGASIGHGLDAKPEFFIVKNRDAAEPWGVYHSSQGATKYAFLNVTNSFSPSTALWNDTEPTPSVITLGNYNGTNNSDDFICYAWAPVEGYSAFGSYTAGSEPFVYTGFKPRYLLIKNSSSNGSNWVIHDTARSPYNYVYLNLSANLPNGDNGNAAYPFIDILSNGFKLRSTYLDYNQGSDVYVYAAWAEDPFRSARAR